MQMDENIKICAECGHANSEDHNFCESCGCRLDKPVHENENTEPMKTGYERLNQHTFCPDATAHFHHENG